jgi:hypothetical protein
MKKNIRRVIPFIMDKFIPPRPQDVVFEVNDKGELSGFKINAVFKDDHLDYLNLEHNEALESFAGFVLFMKNNYNFGDKKMKFKVGDEVFGKTNGRLFGRISGVATINGRGYYEAQRGYFCERLYFDVYPQEDIENNYDVRKTFSGEVTRFMNSHNGKLVVTSNYTDHSFVKGCAIFNVECNHGNMLLVENRIKAENVYKLLEEFVLGGN